MRNYDCGNTIIVIIDNDNYSIADFQKQYTV